VASGAGGGDRRGQMTTSMVPTPGRSPRRHLVHPDHMNKVVAPAPALGNVDPPLVSTTGSRQGAGARSAHHEDAPVAVAGGGRPRPNWLVPSTRMALCYSAGLLPGRRGKSGAVAATRGGAEVDGHRFDDLVKRAANTSRRRLLAGLLGGLAAVGAERADAQRSKAKTCGGKPCGPGNTCLTGSGKPVCCPDARVCGQACRSAPCGEGETCCGGACVAITTTRNCGRCDNACAPGQSCVDGACAAIVCPTQPRGCCTCNYQETATGYYISTCHIVETALSPNCNEVCQANVPAGTTQVGQGTSSAYDTPAGQMLVCNDINSPPEFTGFACGSVSCTPAGA